MRSLRVLVVLALAAVGCGDNIVPSSGNGGGAPVKSPGGVSSVGGSQVSHSKSFTLVSTVGHGQRPSSNGTFTMKTGLESQ